MIDRERLLRLQSFMVLPLIGVALRLGGVRRAAQMLRRLGAARVVAEAALPSDEASRRIESALRVVRAASRDGLIGTCLSRSLLLWWLLRRMGLDTDLRFGVQPVNAGLDAHAWVEIDGRPVNDDESVYGQYTAFPQGASARLIHEPDAPAIRAACRAPRRSRGRRP